MSAGDPYCKNCKYNLSGLTESSKCPECGKPLVEVLTRPAFDAVKLGWGRRYRSPIMLFGLPLIHVALGPSEDGPKGKARGIVAIGDQARGLLAVGGSAFGVAAVGGMARGVFALGGMALGLFTMGGWSVGVVSWGGAAMGLLATGGGAVGGIASGGGAFGYYAAGGGVGGKYVVAPYRQDEQAVEMFTNLSWFFGSSATTAIYRPALWLFLLGFCLLTLIGVLMLSAYLRHSDSPGEPAT